MLFIPTKTKLPRYGLPVVIVIKGYTQEITYTLRGCDQCPDWFEPYHFDHAEENKIMWNKVSHWAALPYLHKIGEMKMSEKQTNDSVNVPPMPPCKPAKPEPVELADVQCLVDLFKIKAEMTSKLTRTKSPQSGYFSNQLDSIEARLIELAREVGVEL